MATNQSKNAYLAKLREERKQFLQVGMDVAWQQFWDILCIALHNPAIMGRNTYGKGRLLKLRQEVERLEKLYRPAFSVNPEADYMQEKLDAQLREIFGDDVAVFTERYPFIRQLDYSKPHREWKDLF